MKRVLDLLVAGVALVAVAPACLLTAILVKVDSKGPVFVTHLHVGRSGRRFSLLKFRTMRAGSGPHLLSLSTDDAASGAVLTDPRLTRVGRLLRRFSLDEIPKLWNVLIGDMSLCGPRPLRADEIAGSWQRQRLGVRPGLRHGRSETPAFPGKVWQPTRSRR